MAFVLDASVAAAWCFEDEATPETDGILDLLAEQPAVTPMLWGLEVANILLVAERRRRLTASQADRFLRILAQLPIDHDPAPPDLPFVVSVGRRHNLSAYDAAYLVLAERAGLALATTDAALQEAARNAGVPLLIS